MLAQYATPAELLLHPADAFVEDFVGADRALKRLALTRVGEIELGPAAGAANGLVVGADDRLRDALSRLLQEGAASASVVDREGRPVGTLTVELIARVAHG